MSLLAQPITVSLTMDELYRVVNGDHDDPHHVLGLHWVDGQVVLRTFRPDAREIRVVPDHHSIPSKPMKHVVGGIFEARYPELKNFFPYQLEVRYEHSKYTIRDAYAFPPTIGELDLHLAAEGTHEQIHKFLGSHVRTIDGVTGTSFGVWAPSARRVSVVGDFNSWDGRLHAMRKMGQGFWELFIPEVRHGAIYKFEIKTQEGALLLKTDPYGRAMELRPKTAARVYESRYSFNDQQWIEARKKEDPRHKPMSIYEVHLGSWRRVPSSADEHRLIPPEESRWMTYRELADKLVDYVADLGFTHVELLPVMEHPLDASWGYQVSGYFAPTSRFGDPDDFRYFVDRCHQKGIGVLLDWTPAHFLKDEFALGRFDGSALYEHLDPRRGEHREWQTYIFNYGRFEVKNFLIANALYWLEEFHIDGLRVDAVASMLYLDYAAEHPDDWLPNQYGGRENIEAIHFIRELCNRVHDRFPGAILCAEESTTWPGVTHSTQEGGLGFDFKWNMGWMHDSLDYMKHDPIYRGHHHDLLTFGLMYAFTEKFLLPLSHDEVVHLKRSLLDKMSGDLWQKFANLRAMYGLMWAHPGKKLLFMGGEFGQWKEWNEAIELEWYLTAHGPHRGIQQLFRDMNRFYKEHPALFDMDDEYNGFRWLDANSRSISVYSFTRFARPGAGNFSHHVICATNLTPVPRYGYRVGVPRRLKYLEVINTDAMEYGGSGMGNMGAVMPENVASHGHAQSIVLTLPPLSTVWFAPEFSNGEGPIPNY